MVVTKRQQVEFVFQPANSWCWRGNRRNLCFLLSMPSEALRKIKDYSQTPTSTQMMGQQPFKQPEPLLKTFLWQTPHKTGTIIAGEGHFFFPKLFPKIVSAPNLLQCIVLGKASWACNCGFVHLSTSEVNSTYKSESSQKMANLFQSWPAFTFSKAIQNNQISTPFVLKVLGNIMRSLLTW